MGKRAIYGDGWIPVSDTPSGMDHVFDDPDIDFDFAAAAGRFRGALRGRHATTRDGGMTKDLIAWKNARKYAYGQ